MKPGFRNNAPGRCPALRSRIRALRFKAAGWICAAFAGWVHLGTAAEPGPVVAPLEFRNGQFHTTARVNGSEPMTFLIDTGYEMTMLHPARAESLGLRRAGQVTIAGIAGDEDADVFAGATFDFGGLTYAPRRVAALPSETRRRQRRDGILGSGFFRRFVVEIDPAAREIRLHEPERFQYTGSGAIIALDLNRPIPAVEATLVATNAASAAGRFQIDAGCTGVLCVAGDFAKTHQLVPDSVRAATRSGVGGLARVHTGRLAQLTVGSVVVERPQANFFLQGSPVRAGLAGHIGVEALRRFRVIFDYPRQRMILEPLPPAAK